MARWETDAKALEEPPPEPRKKVEAAERLGLEAEQQLLYGHRALDEQRSQEDEWSEAVQVPVKSDMPTEAFQSPEAWVEQINPTDGAGPNCVDCARAVEATWRGDPEIAAPIREGANGKPSKGTSSDRITQWTGGHFVPTDYAGIEQTLDFLGEGSSAIVTSNWVEAPDAGHAYNAVNDRGVVKFVDGQSAIVSEWPPASWSEDDVFDTTVVFIDQAGKPIV